MHHTQHVMILIIFWLAEKSHHSWEGKNGIGTTLVSWRKRYGGLWTESFVWSKLLTNEKIVPKTCLDPSAQIYVSLRSSDTIPYRDKQTLSRCADTPEPATHHPATTNGENGKDSETQ